MMRAQDVCGAAVISVAIGLATLRMAGCGSSAQTGQTGSSPMSAVASSSTMSAQGSTSSASTHPIDVCAVLPAASAAKFSGLAVTIGNARAELQLQEYRCAYTNGDDSVQCEVTVFEHDAATSYDFFLSGSTTASLASGLGDKAFFDNDGTMYVLKGNNLIQVNGVKTSDQCAAVARPVVAAL